MANLNCWSGGALLVAVAMVVAMPARAKDAQAMPSRWCSTWFGRSARSAANWKSTRWRSRTCPDPIERQTGTIIRPDSAQQ